MINKIIDLNTLDIGITIDLKYATQDNFTQKIVYKNLDRALLQEEGVQKIIQAQQLLQSINPRLTLHIWDAGRPEYAQYILWNHVKDTPQQIYIADPSIGSLHTYAMAVDITLATKDGQLLDMGTGFDYFGDLAHPEFEAQMLLEKKITHAQISNRLLLRYIMTASSCSFIPHEWWHFNLCDLEYAKKNYTKLE